MFDTVRLATELDLDPGRLRGWKEHVTRDPDESTGELRESSFFVHKSRDGSPYLSYSPKSAALVCEGSLPKLLWGENVRMLSPSDVPLALDSLSDKVAHAVHGPVPHCGTWRIRRLDAVYSWQVGERRIPDYLHALSQLHLPRHRTDYIDSAHTVYWKTERRWLRSYDKFAETGLPSARGILRFEAEMMRSTKKELEKIAGVKENARAKDVLNWDNASAILGHWLDALGTDLVISDDEKLFALLVEKCGRSAAVRLMGFIFASRLYGRDELLAKGFRRDYLWRNSKVIARSGASIASAKSGLLPGLRLPADYDGSPGTPG